MAVFSKFAVSVVAVAVGYGEERCETASALRMEQHKPIMLDGKENNYAHHNSKPVQVDFERNQAGLYEYIKENASKQLGQDHSGAYRVEEISSKISLQGQDNLALVLPTKGRELELLREKIVLDSTMKTVAKVLPGTDKREHKAFDLLKDIGKLQEYCEEFNKLGLSTDDVVALIKDIKDMPRRLQDIVLDRNSIQDATTSERDIFLKNLKAELTKAAPQKLNYETRVALACLAFLAFIVVMAACTGVLARCFELCAQARE